jgi:hypothetical protein
MNTTSIVATALAVVLIMAMVIGAIVYATQQGTERRKDCTDHQGTWIDGRCLIINPGEAIE